MLQHSHRMRYHKSFNQLPIIILQDNITEQHRCQNIGPRRRMKIHQKYTAPPQNPVDWKSNDPYFTYSHRQLHICVCIELSITHLNLFTHGEWNCVLCVMFAVVYALRVYQFDCKQKKKKPFQRIRCICVFYFVANPSFYNQIRLAKRTER